MHAQASGTAFGEETVSVWNGELDIHVKVAGSGPPLLHLYSAGGPRWLPFLDRLSEEHTIYAPELPGTSPADPHAIHRVESFADLVLIYEEVVRGLGIEGAAAMGESLGGMIGVDLAAHFPAIFSKLVLLAPAGLWRPDNPPPMVEVFSLPAEEAPAYLFHDPGSDIAKAFFALPEDPELIPPLIASLVWAQGCAAKFLWPIPDHGVAKRLHRVTVPTLIIHGREDRVMPVVHGEEYHARIAGSRLEIIESCGHIPHVEALERTYELVAEFLGS
jgi:pimeloyl-ACP methyl ester carboxylesterase